ncbi:ribosomal protein S5 domain 2-type protein [Aspergillus egyptiacus]|nr:ribosomal protein S5 domain 2-type protein [Aspergillus egyptiacus]
MSADLSTLQNTELAEEIEAINAIYEPDTITVTNISSSSTTASTLDLGTNSSASPAETSTTIKLQVPNHPHLSFLLAFGDTYPDTRPRILGTASTAARGEGKIAIDVLEDILNRTYQPGAVCLFDVINEVIEVFEELSIGGTNDAATGTTSTQKNKTEEDTDDATLASNMNALSLHESLGLESPPDWILSEVITEKKSVFVGRAAHVSSLDQAQKYIDYLLATDKKVASATHNISAWRIRQKSTRPTVSSNTKDRSADGKGSASTSVSSTEMIIQDCDDDGETAAGGRLLHLMQLMDVWDVVVVVTRWYGGVLLGPDRFRIINAAGRDALVRGGFAKEKEKEGATEKGKKKGKK